MSSKGLRQTHVMAQAVKSSCKTINGRKVRSFKARRSIGANSTEKEKRTQENLSSDVRSDCAEKD